MIDPRAPFISASSRPALEISSVARGASIRLAPEQSWMPWATIWLSLGLASLHIGTYDGPKMNLSWGPDRGDEVSRRAVQPANIWFTVYMGCYTYYFDLILLYIRIIDRHRMDRLAR